MILKILFNGKIYLAKVDSTEYGYKFRFKEGFEASKKLK